MACGCTQAPGGPATPTTATTAPTTEPTTMPAGPKQIDIAAWETEHNVVMQYNGGRDAADLIMLRVQIDNKDGKIIKTPIYSPEIGKQYEFSYVGVPNPNTMNVIGVFKDGTEQTVLIKYF